jgi:hypothetical protein
MLTVVLKNKGGVNAFLEASYDKNYGMRPVEQ